MEGFLFALFIFWINTFSTVNIGLKSLYITLSGLRQKVPEKSGVQVSAGILHLTSRCSSDSTNAHNIASSPCRDTCTAALKRHHLTERSWRTGPLKQLKVAPGNLQPRCRCSAGVYVLFRPSRSHWDTLCRLASSQFPSPCGGCVAAPKCASDLP